MVIIDDQAIFQNLPEEELRRACAALGLPIHGTHAELEARLGPGERASPREMKANRMEDPAARGKARCRQC